MEKIEGLVNDKFVMVLAPSTVDTHAMDPLARDPSAMDPSVSDLPLNDPEAIVSDVVKVNTELQLLMVYYLVVYLKWIYFVKMLMQ